MSITTTSGLPAPVQQSFSYKLLSVPVPNMIHKIPAELKSMPRNGGRTLRMRRYNPLAVAVVKYIPSSPTSRNAEPPISINVSFIAEYSFGPLPQMPINRYIGITANS